MFRHAESPVICRDVCVATAQPDIASFNFNVLTLNLRGYSHLKWHALANLVEQKDIAILCLTETHQHVSAARNAQLTGCARFFAFRCDAERSALGVRLHGVAILVRKDLCDPDHSPVCVFADDGIGRVIAIDIRLRDARCIRVACIYAPVRAAERTLFFHALPWALLRGSLVGGDYNARLSLRDANPPLPAVEASALALSDLLFHNDMFDAFDILDDDEPRPPTHRGPYRDVCIDRWLVGEQWQALVASVDVVTFAHSDHDAVVASFRCISSREALSPRRPAALPGWLLLTPKAATLLPAIEATVTAATARVAAGSRDDEWAAVARDISLLLWRAFSETKRHRRRRRIINAQNRIRQLTKRCCDPTTPPSVLTRLRQKIAHERNCIVGVDALVFADLAFAYRKAMASACSVNAERIACWLRSRAREDDTTIHTARADVTSPIAEHVDDVLDIHTSFLRRLRCPDVDDEPADDVDMDSVLRFVPSAHATETSTIVADLSIDEITAAIHRARLRASAGPDLISAVIMKNQVPAFAALLSAIWQRRHVAGLPASWRLSYVVMIFKKEKSDRSLPANYRPITILPLAMRVICDAIRFKMRTVIGLLVNPEQRAFVPGRHISSCIAETFCAAYDARKQGAPLAIICFDFVKAYDSLSIAFVLRVLVALGFSRRFVEDIRLIVCGNAARVVINKRIGAPFSPSRGLDQGNALSCYLYILAVSMLPALARARGVGGYVPTPLAARRARGAAVLPLIASMYVDNLVGFASSEADISAWFATLDAFASVSGQRYDIKKTKLVVLGRMSVPTSVRHCVLAGSHLDRNHCDYGESVRILGVLMNARGGLHSNTWSTIIDKQRRTYQCFRSRNWNLRDRASIALIFVLAKLLFVAAIFAVPATVIEASNRLMCRFIYNDKRYIVGLPAAIQPLALGGLTRHGVGAVEHRCAAASARLALRYWQCVSDLHDDWMWELAHNDLRELTGGLSSPVCGLPLSSFRRHSSLPVNACSVSLAHLAAARLLDLSTGEQPSVDALFEAPLFANPLFGSRLRAKNARTRAAAPTARLRDFVLTTGAPRRSMRAPNVRRVVDHVGALAQHWPHLAASVGCAADGVAPVFSTPADFEAGRFVVALDEHKNQYSPVGFVDDTEVLYTPTHDPDDVESTHFPGRGKIYRIFLLPFVGRLGTWSDSVGLDRLLCSKNVLHAALSRLGYERFLRDDASFAGALRALADYACRRRVFFTAAASALRAVEFVTIRDNWQRGRHVRRIPPSFSRTALAYCGV